MGTSNTGINGEGIGKMYVSHRKTGHISESVKDTAKITTNQY